MAPMRGFPNRLGLPKLTARNQTEEPSRPGFGMPGSTIAGPIDLPRMANAVGMNWDSATKRLTPQSQPAGMYAYDRAQGAPGAGPPETGSALGRPSNYYSHLGTGAHDMMYRVGRDDVRPQTLPWQPGMKSEAVLLAGQYGMPQIGGAAGMNGSGLTLPPPDPNYQIGQWRAPVPGSTPAPAPGVSGQHAAPRVLPRLGANDIPAGSKDWMPLAPPGPNDPPRLDFWKTWRGNLTQGEIDEFWGNPRAPFPPGYGPQAPLYPQAAPPAAPPAVQGAPAPQRPYSPAAVNPHQYAEPVTGVNNQPQFPMLSDNMPASIRGIRGDSPISRMMTPSPATIPAPASGGYLAGGLGASIAPSPFSAGVQQGAPPQDALGRVQSFRERWAQTYRPQPQAPRPTYDQALAEAQGIRTPLEEANAALNRRNNVSDANRFAESAMPNGRPFLNGQTSQQVIDNAAIPTQPVDGRYAVNPQGKYAAGGRYFLPPERSGASVGEWRQGMAPIGWNPEADAARQVRISTTNKEGRMRDASGRLLSEITPAEWESRRMQTRERQAQKLQETMAARSAARLARARGGRPGSVAVPSGVASVALPSAGVPAGTAAPAPEKPFSYTDSGLWSEVRNKSVEERRKYMRSKGLSFGEIDRLEKQFGEWDAESKKTDNFNRGYNWRW